MRRAFGRRLSALGSVLVLVTSMFVGPTATAAHAAPNRAAPDQTAPELAAATAQGGNRLAIKIAHDAQPNPVRRFPSDPPCGLGYGSSPGRFAGATPGFLVWRPSMKWRIAVDCAVAPLGPARPTPRARS